MTKGKVIEIIAVPHGEWTQTICEKCHHAQNLVINKSNTLVCVNKKCNIYKAIVRRHKNES